MIRYEAEIRGYHPPYKWKVVRHGGASSPLNVGSGSAESYEDALVDAHAAARESEEARRQDTTKHLEPLFVVDDTARDDASPLQVPDYPFAD